MSLNDAREDGEMMLQRLFRERPAAAAGRGLYAPLIEQARRPAFYVEGRAPDTTTGRFELYSLHLALVTRRLRGEDGFAAEASQALFDTFLSGLDDGLRELGVGDLTVPKKMRKLGEALYGRFRGYDAALADDAAPDALAAMLGRTVYAGVEAPPSAMLADYARAARDALRSTPIDALFDRPLPWPAPVFERLPGRPREGNEA
jgi:cytochrome b pre-mRNA-processing protein 3